MLLNGKGVLKISDMGLAKYFGSPNRLMSSKIVTLLVNFNYLKKQIHRNYRAPEVLFGSEHYSHKIDIWSVGCIMAELFCGRPVFQGMTEIDQLTKIFQIMGTPNV